MFVLAPLTLFVATAAALKSKVKPGSVPVRQLNYAHGPQPNKQAVPETQTEFQYLNEKTEEFLVNGTNFPEVPFDIGESYAGLLNNTPHGESALFFWFFPSTNPDASDEITIWLNGGPGCSSLVGFLQENGRFLWQPGTYEPVSNPFAWDRLTNMVYVDQPAGTGLSPGPSTVKNEFDVSNQFNDFWRRFIDTFDMHGYKIYFAGESYAGQYIPYMASGMLNSVDNKYFNLKGIQINDPSMNEDNVMIYAPSVATLNRYSNFFSLNDTFMSEINERAEKCGYFKFMNEAMSFPPPKDFPVAPDPSEEGCAVFDDIVSAATFINPCFNIYHVPDTCPYLWNLMGFPSMAGGPNNYFNRSDVQEALNVPPTDYWVCNGNIFPNGDGSIPSALGPLPSVIERTNNVVIGHGWYDYLLFVNGSLVTIQNMTWNGAQGFQKPPVEPLVLPVTDKLNEHVNGESEIPYFWNAGAGILGTAHTERGLTFSTVNTAGHQIPQYSPGAAYRQLEFLLGRVNSLQDGAPYTGMQ